MRKDCGLHTLQALPLIVVVQVWLLLFNISVCTATGEWSATATHKPSPKCLEIILLNEGLFQ